MPFKITTITRVAALAPLTALLLLMTPLPAGAALMTGKTLLEACSEPSGSVRRSICLGYIAAISDALGSEGVGKRKACFDKDAKLSAMRDAVVAHLEKQQSAADKPAADGVTVALVNRFACR
ncbi:MAG: Rap1a/Tai family immunity protein [Alphaproteobacteria bacterium]